MAKKGSWSGGRAPAQGSTPQKITRPVEGTGGKLSKRMGQGVKSARRGGAQK